MVLKIEPNGAYCPVRRISTQLKDVTVNKTRVAGNNNHAARKKPASDVFDDPLAKAVVEIVAGVVGYCGQCNRMCRENPRMMRLASFGTPYKRSLWIFED
jgi:hypothetical protein